MENPLNDLKVCGKKYLFSSQSLKTCDNIVSNNLEMNFILFTIYHSKRISQAKYFTLILLLSGDISLNPGPPHNCQIARLSWNVFDKKGLHFLHINVNSLLPKIEEVRFIAKKSKATVIGITETKLDGTTFDTELYIEGYSIVRCDRDRKGGGVACYIKMTSVSALKILPLKKSKSSLWICSFRKPSLYKGIFYRPPTDTIFLQLFAEIQNSLNILENEIFVLGDTNINSYIEKIYRILLNPGVKTTN